MGLTIVDNATRFFMGLKKCSNVSTSRFPSLHRRKEGCPRDRQKYREASIVREAGVVFRSIAKENHPVCARLRDRAKIASHFEIGGNAQGQKFCGPHSAISHRRSPICKILLRSALPTASANDNDNAKGCSKSAIGDG
jgi:hypothetical protein